MNLLMVLATRLMKLQNHQCKREYFQPNVSTLTDLTMKLTESAIDHPTMSHTQRFNMVFILQNTNTKSPKLKHVIGR